MEPKRCKIKDSECHLKRIQDWHNSFESGISSLIETLKGLEDSSIEARKECSEHYARTIELTRAKTRFTFEVSHELKAPLASVYNIINVILDGYLDGDIEKQKGLLDRARVRIKSITELLNDLLMLSRLEERTKELEKEEFNIGEVFSSLIEEMNEYAEKSNIKINWNLSDNCPHIYGNAELIRRVFANIIHNAIKYSNPRGLVEVTGEKENGSFLLRVKDHGIGIKEEELPKIFNIFFRGENARPNRKKEGMGLGLSLVKRIVDAHGGYINVKSQLHKGTTAEVRFPEFQKKEK
ncbi:HAMP domain-containing histidine kinase [candidate division WOR-3 bacterium]|nr:HAMP domain-containing histidine kinase [candidate division WOR-3 bacterium]